MAVAVLGRALAVFGGLVEGGCAIRGAEGCFPADMERYDPGCDWYEEVWVFLRLFPERGVHRLQLFWAGQEAGAARML